MHPVLYAGRVDHARHAPRPHRFSYRVCLAMMDADALDAAPGSAAALFWPWRVLLRLRGRDHLRTVLGGARSLRERVTHLVRERTGIEISGPVRLLTGFGFLAHRFNPVSFLYCLDAAGVVQCIVAEVTNTPWHEQFHYVLDARDQAGRPALAFACPKAFHVSPFMPMDTHYRWRLTPPEEEIKIHIGVSRNGEPLFDAAMKLDRRAPGFLRAASALLRQPFMSLRVVFLIYWQALRLWRKGIPYHPHPDLLPGEPK